MRLKDQGKKGEREREERRRPIEFFFFFFFKSFSHLGLLHLHGRRPRRSLPRRRGADRVALRVGRVVPWRERDGGRACPGHLIGKKKSESTDDERTTTEEENSGSLAPLSPRASSGSAGGGGRRRSSQRRWPALYGERSGNRKRRVREENSGVRFVERKKTSEKHCRTAFIAFTSCIRLLLARTSRSSSGTQSFSVQRPRLSVKSSLPPAAPLDA